MNPVISRCTREDLASARQVLSQFTQAQTPLDGLATFLAADSHFFLTASMGGVWAGWAYAYELARPDGASMLFLYSIDVSPVYRRRGVGTALLIPSLVGYLSWHLQFCHPFLHPVADLLLVAPTRQTSSSASLPPHLARAQSSLASAYPSRHLHRDRRLFDPDLRINRASLTDVSDRQT